LAFTSELRRPQSCVVWKNADIWLTTGTCCRSFF
jgi:hypothetical protein